MNTDKSSFMLFTLFTCAAALLGAEYCIDPGLEDCFWSYERTIIFDGQAVIRRKDNDPSRVDTATLAELNTELFKWFDSHACVVAASAVDYQMTIDTIIGGISYTRSCPFVVREIYKGALNQDTLLVFFECDPGFYWLSFDTVSYLFFFNNPDVINFDSAGFDTYSCGIDGYFVRNDTIIPFGEYMNPYIGLVIPLPVAFEPLSVENAFRRNNPGSSAHTPHEQIIVDLAGRKETADKSRRRNLILIRWLGCFP